MSTNYSEETPDHLVFPFELDFALKQLPEIPSPEVLALLGHCTSTNLNSHLKAVGNELRLEHGPGGIYPRYEIEVAAGLWALIRAAIISSKNIGVASTIKKLEAAGGE